MANATKKVRTKEKTVMVPQVVTEEVPDGITLHLSDDEAMALAAVLRKVAGDPSTTRRGLTAGVLDALRQAEVPMGLTMQGDLTGQVIFD